MTLAKHLACSTYGFMGWKGNGDKCNMLQTIFQTHWIFGKGCSLLQFVHFNKECKMKVKK